MLSNLDAIGKDIVKIITRSYLKNNSRHLFENIAYTGDGPHK